jgi:quercetin dioxygenase-like cupin family protein
VDSAFRVARLTKSPVGVDFVRFVLASYPPTLAPFSSSKGNLQIVLKEDEPGAAIADDGPMSAVESVQRRIYSPVQRDAAIFVETAAESGGQRTLLEIDLAPGGSNAPHGHLSYAERFVCLDGELTVRVDGLLHVLQPGDEATAAIGAVHCFANETSEPVRFHVELTPGHRGFEQALQIGYGLAEDGATNAKGMPKNLVYAAVLLDMSEMSVAGPTRALLPLLRVLARWGRRRGTGAKLVERYVRY